MTLISELSLDHLAVQAGDVGNRLVLRAYSLASTGVGTVTKAELVHLGNHVLHTTCSLYATLWEQGELRNLRRYEQHGRAVLTSSYASATTYARSTVHSLVGILLRNEDGVGILSLTCTDGGIATSLDNLIEGIAVDHTVLDHGEGSRAPGLHSDYVAIVEAAHVELAGCCATLCESVRRTIDVE